MRPTGRMSGLGCPISCGRSEHTSTVDAFRTPLMESPVKPRRTRIASHLGLASNWPVSVRTYLSPSAPTLLLHHDRFKIILFLPVSKSRSKTQTELYIGEEDGLHQRDRKLVTSSYWVVSLPVKDSAWKHSFDTHVYRELNSFIDSIEN
ncbi:hypothetical protein YC2023_025499 [Brassica napus]